VLAAGAELALVAGDPNQAVFGSAVASRPACCDESPAVTLTGVASLRPEVARVVSASRAGCPVAASAGGSKAPGPTADR